MRIVVLMISFLLVGCLFGCSSDTTKSSSFSSSSGSFSSSSSSSNVSSSSSSSVSSSSSSKAFSSSSSSSTEETEEIVYGDNAPIPSYAKITSKPKKYLNHYFMLDGRTTSTSASFRGSELKVYMFWDDSNTFGEVAEVVIPKSVYGDGVYGRRHFKAKAMFVGLNEDGHPKFRAYSYTCERYSS